MDHQAFAQLLGNYGEFVGAIAVVVTLAYLATQIRQNTIAMEKNTEREVLNDAKSWRQNLIRQPEVAELYRKGLSEPESLDPTERLRFRMLLDDLLEHWNHQFFTAFAPRMSRDATGILATPGGIAHWERNKHRYTTEFVAYLDSLENQAVDQ